MKAHPLAELFPMMEDAELADMVSDVKKNGLRQHVVTLDGMILDGRNRHRACELARINPTFTPYKGDNPLAFVLSNNLHRRHLTPSQRAIVAAKLANLKDGQKTSSANLPSTAVTQPDAAKQLNVSTRAVTAARKLINEKPEEVPAVEAGKLTVHAALAKSNPKPADEYKFDKTDSVIPKDIVESWDKANRIGSEMANAISKIKCEVEHGLKTKDRMFAELNNQTLADLKNAYTALKLIIPHAVCPTCQGHQRKSCRTCSGRGFISQFYYEYKIDSKLKSVREKSTARK
jgi:hypothetical protein